MSSNEPYWFTPDTQLMNNLINIINYDDYNTDQQYLGTIERRQEEIKFWLAEF